MLERVTGGNRRDTWQLGYKEKIHWQRAWDEARLGEERADGLAEKLSME